MHPVVGGLPRTGVIPDISNDIQGESDRAHHVHLKRIGRPSWRPVDFHMFSAPVGTAGNGYADFLTTILALMPPPKHQFHPQLAVAGPIVRKGSNGEDGYSGFMMRDPQSGDERPTELEGLLRDRGVQRVVVCGLATDYCVNATALDARRLGFDTTVLTSAIAAVNLKAGDESRALDEMADAGARLE